MIASARPVDIRRRGPWLAWVTIEGTVVVAREDSEGYVVFSPQIVETWRKEMNVGRDGVGDAMMCERALNAMARTEGNRG